MSECVLVYQGNNSLSNDNKALLLAQNLLTRDLPPSPSERYDHILKIAQGAPFCVLDKSATHEENLQGSIHATADKVLKAILPKSTYGLIPLIVSFLNREDIAHPAFKNLFTVIPTDQPNTMKLEGVFMLLPDWESSSLEVYNIKIKQTQETNRRFMRDPVTTWNISGICYHSSFSVMLPMLVDFMQNMEGSEEKIKNVLSNGFDTKAISNSEHFSIMTEFAVIYLEDPQDQRSILEANKIVFAHSLLTHNLPQSPSDRYNYVHKQAKGSGTSICTNEDSKSHTLDDRGNIHFAVDKVLREILPKSTYGLIPTVVSLLNREGDPHPALRKLFIETATSGSKCVEGFFMLLSNWKSLTFEVFHVKIQQTRGQSDTAVAKISGACRSSLFTVTPQSIPFDSMNNDNKKIQRLLMEGLKHGAAIKQCMQSYISSIAGACETTTLVG